jgi:hypothetical protein
VSDLHLCSLIKQAHENGLKLMKGRTFHKQVFNRPKGFDLCVH